MTSSERIGLIQLNENEDFYQIEWRALSILLGNRVEAVFMDMGNGVYLLAGSENSVSEVGGNLKDIAQFSVISTPDKNLRSVLARHYFYSVVKINKEIDNHFRELLKDVFEEVEIEI
ncbi:hypothetical protein BH10PAT1_BH10PAT1_0540 [soil metagenome]